MLFRDIERGMCAIFHEGQFLSSILLDLVIFNKFFKSWLGLQPNSCKTQKQSIWYKKFGSELLTKVPAFAISVRRFYYMNIEGKWAKIHVFGKTAFWGPKIWFDPKTKVVPVTLRNSWFHDKKNLQRKLFLGGTCGVPKTAKKPKMTLFMNP